MHTKRSQSPVAIALVILAIAIAGAGLYVGESISQSSAAQVRAQQGQTAAINAASSQASLDSNAATLAAQQAALTAQHLALLNSLHGPQDTLTAANQAALQRNR